MKKTTKSVLFSTLIFPGSGHLLLRRWLRGLVFIIPVMLAFGYIMNYSVDQALTVIDRILSGDISPDTASIQEVIKQTAEEGQNTLLVVSKIVFIVGWLVAAVDVYMIAKKESRNESKNELGNL